jgi:hypothetical protein
MVALPNQHPYRLTILSACMTYSYQWALAFGVTRWVPPGAQFETKAIYDAADNMEYRAFVGWTSLVWFPDDVMADPEYALFSNWENENTIYDCLIAWQLQMYNEINNGTWRLPGQYIFMAEALMSWQIAGSSDLTCNDGGVIQ